MHPFVREQLPTIITLCKRHRVRRLALFGSAIDESFDAARSDVDLLVDFEPLTPEEHYDEYFALTEDLEKALGRRVDVVERKNVRNPYVRRSIEEHHVLLYDAA